MFELYRFVRNPRAYLATALVGAVMSVGVYTAISATQTRGAQGIGDLAASLAVVFNLPEILGGEAHPARTAPAGVGGMAAALPPGQDGWTRRDWQAGDGDLLVAASQGLGGDASALGPRAVGEFLEVARGEVPGVLQTYARGEERIVVMIRRLPVAYAGGGQLSLAERENAAQQMIDAGIAPLAVQGVTLGGYAVPTEGAGLPFERLRAALSGQVAIEVASNADRASLVGLLSGIDMEALNAFADVPDPIVSAAKGVVIAPDIAAFGRAGPEVTRGVSPTVAPLAPEEERAKTGVCVRRAGVRLCE